MFDESREGGEGGVRDVRRTWMRMALKKARVCGCVNVCQRKGVGRRVYLRTRKHVGEKKGGEGGTYEYECDHVHEPVGYR